jgi:carboxymethylenebutenolidase
VAEADSPASTTPASSTTDWLADAVAFEQGLGGDEWRLARLQRSSRRHDELSLAGLGATQRAFVAYPDKPGPAATVILVPEDQGLNTWARSMADEIAAMGFVALVPDLFAGRGPGGGGSEAFADVRSKFVVSATLPHTSEAAMTAQLNFWTDYARTLSAFNGKLAAVGFAWGGGRALWFATQRKDLAAVVVFYDTAPPAEALAGLSAPLYGFYAERDLRVRRSLDATRAVTARLGKYYEEILYPAADHMFVRLGEEPRGANPANIIARHQSLARLQQILRGL